MALNFARQHGGIAANELPDIVNFISQALDGVIGDKWLEIIRRSWEYFEQTCPREESWGVRPCLRVWLRLVEIHGMSFRYFGETIRCVESSKNTMHLMGLYGWAVERRSWTVQEDDSKRIFGTLRGDVDHKTMGFPMGFQLDVNGIPLWDFNGMLMGFQWDVNGISNRIWRI